nr:hypothetical protein [uncultured bacterium]
MKKIIAIVLLSIITNSPLYAKDNIDPKANYALCAATNAIIASKMEPGILADTIKSEARRYNDLAINAGATQDDVYQMMDAIKTAYNNGEWSWEKIVNLGQSCSNI